MRVTAMNDDVGPLVLKIRFGNVQIATMPRKTAVKLVREVMGEVPFRLIRLRGEAE